MNIEMLTRVLSLLHYFEEIDHFYDSGPYCMYCLYPSDAHRPDCELKACIDALIAAGA